MSNSKLNSLIHYIDFNSFKMKGSKRSHRDSVMSCVLDGCGLNGSTTQGHGWEPSLLVMPGLTLQSRSDEEIRRSFGETHGFFSRIRKRFVYHCIK